MIIISMIAFWLIQLPPGDYVEQKIIEYQRTVGDAKALEALAFQLRSRYALDKPVYWQYAKWVSGFVRGDFGQSFEYRAEVKDIIWSRLGFTMLISAVALIITYILAIPVGVYSATHQYSVGDSIFSFLSFVSISVPPFLVALVLLVLAFRSWDVSLVGLFSPEFEEAPWSLAKLLNLLSHLWVPSILFGLAGIGGLMRIMRGNLLDVLGQQYVTTARAKGLKEGKVVWKHAMRVAINPIISILGLSLPALFSGAVLIEIVMGLPTIGPMLFRALLNQDMFLAGTCIMMLSLILIIGNFFADIALAWVDPRIRFE
jgi:peptide/nickel transport system permease protein